MAQTAVPVSGFKSAQVYDVTLDGSTDALAIHHSMGAADIRVTIVPTSFAGTAVLVPAFAFTDNNTITIHPATVGLAVSLGTFRFYLEQLQ